MVMVADVAKKTFPETIAREATQDSSKRSGEILREKDTISRLSIIITCQHGWLTVYAVAGSLSMLVGLLTRLLTRLLTLRGFPNSSNLVFFVCL